MSAKKPTSAALLRELRETFWACAPDKQQAVLRRLRRHSAGGDEQSNEFWGKVYEWLEAEANKR